MADPVVGELAGRAVLARIAQRWAPFRSRVAVLVRTAGERRTAENGDGARRVGSAR